MAGINRLERIVASSEDGQELYRMMIPAGWDISAYKNQNTYNGYGFPFSVIVRITSPDETAAAMYHSTLHYTDDYLVSYPEGSIDDFGVLHRTYEGPELIVAERGDIAFGSTENPEVAETVRDPVYNSLQKQREEEIRAAVANDPLTVIEKVSYVHVRREYTFLLDGVPHRGCFAATVEAVRSVRWMAVPGDIGISPDDPSLSAIVAQSFPNIHYDQRFGAYIYTAKYSTDVHLYGQFACWAPADRYEEEYRTVFAPMIRGGAVMSEELKQEMRISQDVIDRRNRAIREEKRLIAEENRKTAQINLEKGKTFREELQKTADTIRIALLNQNNRNPMR